MDESMTNLLQRAGFSQKEAKVYLALLQLGRGDVTDIAKISGLKRSIIYVLLDGLMARGHVSMLEGKKVNTYQPHDPSIILAELRMTTKNFGEMLPFLRSLRNKGKHKPRLAFIETKKGIWKVYEEVFQAKEAFVITSYKQIQNCFPKSVEDWTRQYKKDLYQLEGKHLIPNNEEEIRLGKLVRAVKQEVRVLKDYEDLGMDFILYENKLAITSLEEDPFMVVIESQEVAQSFRKIFEIVWRNSKDI